MNPVPKTRLPMFPALTQQQQNNHQQHQHQQQQDVLLYEQESATFADWGGDRLAFSLHYPSRKIDLNHEGETSSLNLIRSRSIPINGSNNNSKHGGAAGMKRTPSELKLREDEEVADLRDYLMFCRIVDGITRKQQETRDLRFRKVNDMCLAHIIGTRNASEDDLLKATANDYSKLGFAGPTNSLQSMVEHAFYGYAGGGIISNNHVEMESHDEEVFSMDL